MIRVLVTGANGQLGKTFQELAIAEESIIFDFKGAKDLDITNSTLVREYLIKGYFDYVINCAAYTAVDKAEEEEETAISINADSVRNLALNCKETNSVLVHISTDYVFDGEKKGEYIEEDITSPINIYGLSKLKGEQHIKEVLDRYYIIRTSWLYSKKYGKNFYRFVKESLLQNKKISIVNNQFGKPTETDFLAKKIIKLIKSRKNNYGVYHVAGNKTMSWYEFALEVSYEIGLEKQHLINSVTYFETKAKRPQNSVLSTTKIENLI